MGKSSHEELPYLFVKLKYFFPQQLIYFQVCTDGEGRVYYYHEEERVAQWEPPTPEQEVEEGQEYNQYQETSGIEEKMEEVGIETNSTDEEEDEEESDEEVRVSPPPHIR